LFIPQRIAAHKHEPDHIIPKQHDGETQADNLALACVRCNRYKGYNVGSFDPETGQLVSFYDPRIQIWSELFQLEGAIIPPSRSSDRKMLHSNDADRVEERERLMAVKLYS
jgi:hypothetical protein